MSVNFLLFVILEAVAGIVGRADVGSAMFFLCSLLCYKKATDRLKSDPESSTNMFGIFLCLLFALGAMYTKEQGVTVLGVCVVYEILMVSKCNLSFPKSILKTVSTILCFSQCLSDHGKKHVNNIFVQVVATLL